MIGVERRLSDRLLEQAQELAGEDAGDFDQTEFDEGVKEIKLMLGQAPADFLTGEYFKILFLAIRLSQGVGENMGNKQAAEYLMNQAMAARALEGISIIADGLNPTEAELEEYYNMIWEEYRKRFGG
jgi:hypothetical protein